MSFQIYTWNDQNIEKALKGLNNDAKGSSLGVSSKLGIKKISWVARIIQWILPCCMYQRTKSKHVIPRIISLFEFILKEQNGKNYFSKLYTLTNDWKNVNILLDRAKKVSESYSLTDQDDEIILKFEEELKNWSDPHKHSEKKQDAFTQEINSMKSDLTSFKARVAALRKKRQSQAKI